MQTTRVTACIHRSESVLCLWHNTTVPIVQLAGQMTLYVLSQLLFPEDLPSVTVEFDFFLPHPSIPFPSAAENAP